MQTPNTNRPKDDAKAAKPPAEPPTIKHSGYEDKAGHVVIDRPLYQAAVEAKEIVILAPAMVSAHKSTTTRMTPQRFDAHLRLYNRFQALADDDCQDCVEVAVLDEKNAIGSLLERLVRCRLCVIQRDVGKKIRLVRYF
jgi:hypothetical protein